LSTPTSAGRSGTTASVIITARTKGSRDASPLTSATPAPVTRSSSATSILCWFLTFLPRFVDAELAPPVLCSKGCLLALATKNRLKDSTSPYLRSAAHQPIDWNEWGDAAFERAKAED